MCRVIVIYCIHKLILFIMIIFFILYITSYMYDLYMYISVHLTSALILVWPPSCGHLNRAFNFPEGIASSLGNLVWFCSAAKRGSCYLCHLLLHYCHVLCAISAAPPLFAPPHSWKENPHPWAPFIFMSNFHELRLKELPCCTWKFRSLCATWLLPVASCHFAGLAFPRAIVCQPFHGVRGCAGDMWNEM